MPFAQGKPLPPLVQSLAGIWQAALTPDSGPARLFVSLPGTVEDAGAGNPCAEHDECLPGRQFQYAGVVDFERPIQVPPAWSGKVVSLVLERVLGRSKVWVDGRPVEGAGRSLAAPHLYDLSLQVTPGLHRLRIRVDSSDAETAASGAGCRGTGLLGRIELVVTDPVFLREPSVSTDIRKLAATVRVTAENRTGGIVSGNLVIRAVLCGTSARRGGPSLSLPVVLNPGRTHLEAVLPMGEDVEFWDEFSPAMYRLYLELVCTGEKSGTKWGDLRLLDFGMREFVRKGTQFYVNGRTVFLRGTVMPCLFLPAGHPPMDTAFWLKRFRLVKSYGFNHVRFRSWCPPEAAFAAADATGLYVEVDGPARGAYAVRPEALSRLWHESECIQDVFGHHPSFVMLSAGHELAGDPAPALDLVRNLKTRGRNQRLYASGAHSEWTRRRGVADPAAEDYLVAASLNEGDGNEAAGHRPLRSGQPSVAAGTAGGGPSPATEYDYRNSIAGVALPVIAHEIGQHCSFPDLGVTAKYTGPLRPWHYEGFRDRLVAAGLLGRAGDFLSASGRFSLLLCKEEMEAALRTPGLGGFHFSGIQDLYDGGPATAGMLDEFGDSKGLIAPDRFRRFCAPTLPLARFAKRVWSGSETFRARIEIAHYGEEARFDTVVAWKLRDPHGVVASGSFPAIDVSQGRITPVGAISVPLAVCEPPAKLTLSVELRGTEAENRWDLWVYPPAGKNGTAATPAAPVTVAARWDASVRQALADGAAVLLLPDSGAAVRSLPGCFAPAWGSWAGARAQTQVGTLGIFCDVTHPALAQFPTEAHANWQWCDLLNRSRSLILDDLPAELNPIVRVIDTPARCHRLANLFEAQVGPGRLIVCSIDLESALAERPAARQLRHSLLSYLGAREFQPCCELPPDALDLLFGFAPVK